jgi:hypothetical protein
MPELLGPQQKPEQEQEQEQEPQQEPEQEQKQEPQQEPEQEQKQEPQQEPEQEQKQTPEIRLQEGLRAYPLPEFGKQNPEVAWPDIIPPSPEEAQEQFNQLLADIEGQGGELVACVDIPVAIPNEPGVMSNPSASKPQTFMIIEKQH